MISIEIYILVLGIEAHNWSSVSADKAVNTHLQWDTCDEKTDYYCSFVIMQNGPFRNHICVTAAYGLM